MLRNAGAAVARDRRLAKRVTYLQSGNPIRVLLPSGLPSGQAREPRPRIATSAAQSFASAPMQVI